MIPVYEDQEIVGQVKYNSNLDSWNGHNQTCGSTGRHKGITMLKNGKFVLIHGTQWQGENDYAEVVSEEQALKEILHHGHDELLDLPKFARLKALKEKTLQTEQE